jgi:hypothetical protein
VVCMVPLLRSQDQAGRRDPAPWGAVKLLSLPIFAYLYKERDSMVFIDDVVYGAVMAALGFAFGRVKNRAKLQAAQDFLDKEEAKASAEAKSLIARLRASL